MQDRDDISDAEAVALGALLDHDRLGRYLAPGYNDAWLALQFYMWNAELCAGFSLPIQVMEVAVRNAISKSIEARFGPNWFDSIPFGNWLNQERVEELRRAVAVQRKSRDVVTAAHVVSELSFGFWEYMTTSSWSGQIWAGGIQLQFPHAPSTVTLAALNQKINAIRLFRNRIAHHKAIFDKNPTRKHDIILEVVGWIDPQVRGWLARRSSVSAIIGARPVVVEVRVLDKQDDTVSYPGGAVLLKSSKHRLLSHSDSQNWRFQPGQLVDLEDAIFDDKPALITAKLA